MQAKQKQLGDPLSIRVGDRIRIKVSRNSKLDSGTELEVTHVNARDFRAFHYSRCATLVCDYDGDIPGVGSWERVPEFGEPQGSFDPTKQEVFETNGIKHLAGVEIPAGSMDPDLADSLQSPALKFDHGKPRLELLSFDALRRTAKVMTFGAQKYADHNWRKGFDWSRLYGAALRHLLAHMNGEDLDPETRLSHLDHAACCIMFLQEHEERSLGNDDRYKGNTVQEADGMLREDDYPAQCD